MPRLELRDQTWLDLWILFKEVVQPVCRCPAYLLHPPVQLRILRLRYLDDPERAIDQIRVEHLRAVDLRGAPQRLDVAVLDLPEIVLCLRVHETEDDALVGRTVNVRDPPFVAVYRYAAGQFRKAALTALSTCVLKNSVLQGERGQ